MGEFIEPRTQLLNYVYQLMQMYSQPMTVVPADFHNQAKVVKSSLMSDVSGIVSSVLDFAIGAASTPIRIDTQNETFSSILNQWLYNINSELRGKIPVGINALAKEYFRERWKGSSLIVMRVIWKKVGDFELPVRCWFVDGGSVLIKADQESLVIGDEQYHLQISKNKKVLLPTSKDESIFVQKPYGSWGPEYPVPFLIQRGIYKNMKLLELLHNKGEKIVSSALEYLLLVKKGSQDLAKLNNENFIYSTEDLTKIKEDFDKLIAEKKSRGGIPTHVTNFDTEMQEMLPDYEKVLKSALYNPIEKRILSGLGLIEVFPATSGSRTQSVINPKIFMSDVNTAADDFATLIDDLTTEIIERNRPSHKKFAANAVTVHRDPIKEFIDNDFKTLMRGLFDRGALSFQTLVEVVGEGDFELELMRRRKEKAAGVDELMKPHPTQPEMVELQSTEDPDIEEVNEDQDKKGVEVEKFINAKNIKSRKRKKKND